MICCITSKAVSSLVPRSFLREGGKRAWYDIILAVTQRAYAHITLRTQVEIKSDFFEDRTDIIILMVYYVQVSVANKFGE